MIFTLTTEQALALRLAPFPGSSPEYRPTAEAWIDGYEESTGEDYLESRPGLADDIRANGQRTPVALVDGELADGLHRIAVARLLRLPVLATDGQDGEWE